MQPCANWSLKQTNGEDSLHQNLQKMSTMDLLEGSSMKGSIEDDYMDLIQFSMPAPVTHRFLHLLGVISGAVS